MPNDKSPDCSDLISPTIDFQKYEEQIVKELAAGLQRGESAEQVIKKLAKDPEFKEEANKFQEYANALLKRQEPKIREEYNKQIQDLQKERVAQVEKLEQAAAYQRQETERAVQQYKEERAKLESEITRKQKAYSSRLESLLQSVDQDLESKASEKAREQKEKGWWSRFVEYVVEKFYITFPNYRPEAVKKELVPLHEDVSKAKTKESE